MPHLHIAITAHGYGHLAQVAPIAHALRRQRPTLRISLQGDIAPAVVAARLPPDIRHIQEAADVALPMASPLQVRWEEALARYIAFDAEHARHLARQRARLAEDPPDLVLADVPWIPLVAARTLGIPAVALCSLNWLDILAASPIAGRLPGSLVERMHDAYAGAVLFLRPRPSMPMAWLPNGRDIGPIAQPRPRDPRAIRARLGVDPRRRLVLILFGGTGGLAIGKGPSLPEEVCLLAPDARTAPGRDDVLILAEVGLDLLDVLASCDAIVTKPGYGSFTEAACHGIPVLYVPRPDWPEEEALVDWLRGQVPTRSIAAADLAAGRLAEALAPLLAAGPVAPVPATGIEESVALLDPYFG